MLWESRVLSLLVGEGLANVMRDSQKKIVCSVGELSLT